MKLVFSQYLLDEDLEPCAEWCFGLEYKNFPKAIYFCEAWNKLHGDVFLINESNTIYEDVQKMVNLWKEHLKEDLFK